jgi:hypothetical protein
MVARKKSGDLDKRRIMNIDELINQKLEWLKQADECGIVQKISTVCFLLGDKVENNRGIKFNKLQVKDIEFYATWDTCGFNTSIGAYNHKLTGWVMISKTCVCRLSYMNEIPQFPVQNKATSDIETDNYVFIPGTWLDILSEKYDIAMRHINSQKVEEEKERVRKLAAQLLIDPKVEV